MNSSFLNQIEFCRDNVALEIWRSKELKEKEYLERKIRNKQIEKEEHDKHMEIQIRNLQNEKKEKLELIHALTTRINNNENRMSSDLYVAPGTRSSLHTPIRPPVSTPTATPNTTTTATTTTTTNTTPATATSSSEVTPNIIIRQQQQLPPDDNKNSNVVRVTNYLAKSMYFKLKSSTSQIYNSLIANGFTISEKNYCTSSSGTWKNIKEFYEKHNGIPTQGELLAKFASTEEQKLFYKSFHRHLKKLKKI